jgi:hypothetical protein
MGFMLDVPDHGQYLSWYKGFQTSLLVSNKLTPEPNDPMFFNLLWFSLGRIGAWTGWDYRLIYQLFRLVSSVFFLAILYLFCAIVMTRLSWRRTAFAIISLGSGMGWIWVVQKYVLGLDDVIYPLDVYVAEGNSLLSMLGYPHFIAAAGLILAVFSLLLLGARQEQIRYAIAAGIVALILGWQHAYDILILYGIPGIYALLWAIQQRRLPSYWIKALFTMGLISVWPALYSVWLTMADPLWEKVLAQFANAGVFTPNPFHLLILMGLPLITASITLVIHVCQRSGPVSQDSVYHKEPEPFNQGAKLFILTWFVVGFFLNYIPTDFQIHMLNSWQVPVGILATWGIYVYGSPFLKRKFNASPRALSVLFILLILPTTIYLIVWRFVDLQRYTYPYYLSRDEVAALEWLEANTAPDDIVLSSLTIGQYIPGIAGNTAFLAHWAQTVDFYTKEAYVTAFYSKQTADQVRKDILDKYKIAYVFYGPIEQAIGSYVPNHSNLLELVFSRRRVQVYAVKSHPDRLSNY